MSRSSWSIAIFPADRSRTTSAAWEAPYMWEPRMERSLFPRRTTAPQGKTSFSSKSRATKVLKWSVSWSIRSTTTSGETRGPNTFQSAFPSACAGRVKPDAYSGLRLPSGVSGSGISPGRENPSRSRMWVGGTPIRESSAIPRFSRVAEAITATSAERARAAATNSLADRSAPQTSTRRPGGSPSSSKIAAGFARRKRTCFCRIHTQRASITKRRPSWKNVSLYSPFNPFPVAPKKASVPPGARAETSNGKFSPPVCSKILSTGFPPFASKTALRNGSVRRSHSAYGIPAGITPNASFGIERRSTKASAIPRAIRSRASSGLEPTSRTRAPRDFAIWAPGKLVPFPPPITRTASPGRTESRSATARYAVPYVRSMAASLSGVWFRRAPVTGTARSSSTTANWALNPSCVSYPRMFRPVHESRMTAWPTLTVETPGPASTTIPRASLPGTCTDAVSPFPNTGTGSPSAAKFVLKLGPVARIATRTRFASFGFRRGAGTASRRTDRDGGPYWSRWIVSASIRRGSGFPSDGARPRGQESSCGVNGSDMSESSGSLVRSGNPPAGQGVRLFRCAFPCGVFIGQTLFCAFPGKTGAGDNISAIRFVY